MSEGIKESSVGTLTAPTRLAPAMDFALKDLVYARKAGKVSIVRPWTKMHCNVFQTALGTELSMSTPKLVRVTPGGLVTIARKVRVI